MESKLTDLPDLTPSGDYALNSFLLTLNDDLDDDDLEKLKFLCTGKYGIGEAILEKVKKPIHLFEILRKRQLLNTCNLITLQAMLWVLRRKDLQLKYVKFAESQKSSIYFIVPKDSPENGYEFVKFHIKGADLDKYGTGDMGKLRSKISELLFVPPEFVIIAGIQPSQSLLITVMLLKDDAQRMLTLPPSSLAVLTEVHVDKVMIGNETIILSGEATPVTVPDPAGCRMEEELENVLLRDKQKETELENVYITLFKLQSLFTSNSRFLHYIMVVLLQECRDIYNKICEHKKLLENVLFNPVDELHKTSVFAAFRHRLQKVRELGYNEVIIYDLLDAQALVFQWHRNERKSVEVERLKIELAFLALEKEKLAYYHQIGVRDKIMSQRDEFFFTAMIQNIPVVQNVEIHTQLSEECVDYVFRRLSQDVSEYELATLNKISKEQGKINSPAAASAYEYLMNSWKEQKGVELHVFVQEVLVIPLKRLDFLKQLDKYVIDFHDSKTKPEHASNSSDEMKRGSPSSKESRQYDMQEEIIKRLSNIEACVKRLELNPQNRLHMGSFLDNVGLNPSGIINPAFPYSKRLVE